MFKIFKEGIPPVLIGVMTAGEAAKMVNEIAGEAGHDMSHACTPANVQDDYTLLTCPHIWAESA